MDRSIHILQLPVNPVFYPLGYSNGSFLQRRESETRDGSLKILLVACRLRTVDYPSALVVLLSLLQIIDCNLKATSPCP
jgi:hypothetical protein